MKNVIMAWCCRLAVVVAGCASDPRPVVVGKPLTIPTTNDYCALAQKEIASARVPARNVLASDFQAFSRMTPQVQPLETLQFVQYSDPQKTRPRMISCKLHSAEKIRATYGATAAGESTTCARLNRRTLDAVMASLTERQKKKMPFKGTIPILLDPDEQVANEAHGWSLSPWCRPTPAARCACAPGACGARPVARQQQGQRHGRQTVLPPDRPRLPEAHPAR